MASPGGEGPAAFQSAAAAQDTRAAEKPGGSEKSFQIEEGPPPPGYRNQLFCGTPYFSRNTTIGRQIIRKSVISIQPNRKKHALLK
jgi:hypothetical protein